MVTNSLVKETGGQLTNSVGAVQPELQNGCASKRLKGKRTTV